MKKWAPRAAVFFVIWLILSGSHDAVHVSLGLVVAVAVAWLNPVDPDSPFRHVPWLRFLGYLPWLFVRIVRSGIHLTRLILDPSLPIAPKLIHHRSDLETDGEVVLLGNSITLTPGTITVEVNSRELIVHCIDEASSRDVVDGTLERKIGGVFRRRARSI
jgi:multicomponent Na+:H+ antiporter subunit E